MDGTLWFVEPRGNGGVDHKTSLLPSITQSATCCLVACTVIVDGILVV